MILAAAFISTIVMVAFLVVGLYHLWQVTDLLVSLGFSAQYLAYHLGMYLKCLIGILISGFSAQLLFGLSKV